MPDRALRPNAVHRSDVALSDEYRGQPFPSRLDDLINVLMHIEWWADRVNPVPDAALQQYWRRLDVYATRTRATAGFDRLNLICNRECGADISSEFLVRVRGRIGTGDITLTEAADCLRSGLPISPDPAAAPPELQDVPSASPPSIGIITALPHEAAAIRAVLGDPPRIDVPGAGAGRIYWMADVPSSRGGLRRVVVAQSGIGTNVAAARASLLLSHFPSVDSIIMCGIAGGIPHPDKPDDHVRLGDIVVSSVNGVVQYDFVRRTVRKKKSQVWEEVRSASHRPSAELLDAVHALTADEHFGRRPWDRWLDVGLGRLEWARPDPATDVLVATPAPGLHPSDPKRREGKPRVFLGPIGSANALLKDPAKRNSLRDQFGVKAVEMEGAGIADATWTHGVGYLVVRGICDYADVNKNDTWQNYAAMAAAAYVRALLESMPGPGPELFRRYDLRVKVRAARRPRTATATSLQKNSGHRYSTGY